MSQAPISNLIFGIILLCLPSDLYTAVLPKYFKACHRSDPHLSDCLRTCIEELRPRMSAGIPQLYMPPLEPLTVPEVKLDQDTGAVYLHSTYRNIVVHGLSRFDIKKLHADVDNNVLDVELHFPSLEMKSNYSLKGKIMMMPLRGDGTCNANLTNVEVIAKVCGSRYPRNNQQHFKIDNVSITYKIGDTKLRLENLFNGDSGLGEKMNTFLNENWHAISDEIRPIMENAMGEVMQQTTKKLFEVYTYDQLLPE